MTERCPLVGMVWSADIPNTCRETCVELWDAAIETTQPQVDTFTTECEEGRECDHNIESSDMSLQRGGSEKRFVGILNACEWTGTELLVKILVSIAQITRVNNKLALS